MPRLTVAPISALLLAISLALSPPAAHAQDATAETPAGSTALDTLQNVLPSPEVGECPSRREAEADQVIKMHTQLMVASLVCDELYGDPELHNRYRAFTAKNAEVVLDAQTMLERRLGDGEDGVRLFDEYRTRLANVEADIVAEQSTAVYCAMRRSRFDTLIDAPPEWFTGYVGAVTARELFARPDC
jgi:hypothetical protein